eukprot:m51a1_g7086 putative atpase aaa (863) ;mRNA; r:15089-17928
MSERERTRRGAAAAGGRAKSPSTSASPAPQQRHQQQQQQQQQRQRLRQSTASSGSSGSGEGTPRGLVALAALGGGGGGAGQAVVSPRALAALYAHAEGGAAAEGAAEGHVGDVVVLARAGQAQGQAQGQGAEGAAGAAVAVLACSEYVQLGYVEVDPAALRAARARPGDRLLLRLLDEPPVRALSVSVSPYRRPAPAPGDRKGEAAEDGGDGDDEGDEGDGEDAGVEWALGRAGDAQRLGRYVQAALGGALVCAGGCVRASVYGRPVWFAVDAVSPASPAVALVCPSTAVTVVLPAAAPLGAEGGADEGDEGEGEGVSEDSLGARAARVTYEDVGGAEGVVQALREAVELPLRRPGLLGRYGVRPGKGVLLCGAPGTGKTLAALACAGECVRAGLCAVFSMAGSEAMSRFVGQSEARLRALFGAAQRAAPALVLVDDIDALCPARDAATSEVDRRVVSTLLTLMDGVARADRPVFVVATTSRPATLDPALRRAGRFDREIEIGAPSRDAREQMLRLLLRAFPNSLSPAQLGAVAAAAHGFVGADLSALCREASAQSLRRARAALGGSWGAVREALQRGEELEATATAEDFAQALRSVKPSAMREVVVEVPRVRWGDVGGLEGAKRALREAVEWPMRHPEAFAAMGIRPPAGVLLYGPPGCAKTLLVQALATEAALNFIAVKGPQLLSKYVGESERAVRDVFKKARQNAPSILFFDEIDGLVGGGRGANSEGASRVLSQLLTEMDGVTPLRNVSIVAATNRPDLIDSALLRPGRIDRRVFLGLPSAEDRASILEVCMRNTPHEGVSLEELARATDGRTGAELSALAAAQVTRKHIDAALASLGELTVTPALLRVFDEFDAKQQ